MKKRQVVKTVLQHKQPPYVPWSFKFTLEARQALVDHYKSDDIHGILDNHILELGSDIGFFEPIGNDLYQDVFGVVWDRSIDKDIGNPSVKLTAPTLKGYQFPDPLDQSFFADIPEKIQKYSDCFRVFAIGFSLFERAWSLRGMENLMIDFYDNPGFVKDLFNSIADYNIAQLNKALEYDIDAVYFGDDWGQQHGLLMGKKNFMEFIYPVLQRMYAAVKDSGKFVFIHSCGDVDELFDDLVSAGLDCFNPFQPEVMDIHDIIENYRASLSFWGGLSTQKTLPFGSPQDVKNEVNDLIEMGRKGGYILSPAHSVESDVSLENMLTFIEQVKLQPFYKELNMLK